MRTKPVCINLWAPPGVGKSTTMTGLFTSMKHRGYRVEMAPEFAKQLSYENNRVALDDPFYVMANQEYRLSQLRGKVDYIITDSPPGISEAYCSQEDSVEVSCLAEHFRYRYVNLDVRLLRSPEHPHQTYGRHHTEQQSVALEATITRIMMSHAEIEPLAIIVGIEAVPRIIHWVEQQKI
jgi:hypothetical protein